MVASAPVHTAAPAFQDILGTDVRRVSLDGSLCGPDLVFDYEYDYSYYGGYDQDSTILEVPDLEDVAYITAA
ncbi:hypothetical protein E2C01_064179 [Portunus trituberculatus]|uniref:Uncharacterized protein n=1 Tax=Portunus trituberculatus TaxID=210409 RepID=A0A5B7HJ21_PORTR|nr:hypothetical protein [Portunus trituberculatus]